MRLGFCREDDNGEIVSIWNFSELDEHLRSIESREGALSDGGSDVATNITGRDPAFDSESLVPTCLVIAAQGHEIGNHVLLLHEDGGRNEDNVTRTLSVGDVVYAERGFGIVQSEDFYDDLPVLEEGNLELSVTDPMPGLEPPSLWNVSVAGDLRRRVSRSEVHDIRSSVWTEELYSAWANILEFFATVIIVHAVCMQFGVSDTTTAELVNILGATFLPQH